MRPAGAPSLAKTLDTGCRPAKPSTPDPACPAAVLPSIPTLCGAGRTGSVGLAGMGSCQAPGPGLTAQAGSAPSGWLQAAKLRHHTPTMGMPVACTALALGGHALWSRPGHRQQLCPCTRKQPPQVLAQPHIAGTCPRFNSSLISLPCHRNRSGPSAAALFLMP